MNRGPHGPPLISQLISSSLHMDCSVLMGANVAEDIGREELSEATIGYTTVENGKLLQKLFQRPYFLVNTIVSLTPLNILETMYMCSVKNTTKHDQCTTEPVLLSLHELYRNESLFLRRKTSPIYSLKFAPHNACTLTMPCLMQLHSCDIPLHAYELAAYINFHASFIFNCG